MPAIYFGNASNIQPGTTPSIQVPLSADPRDAASIDPNALQKLTDYVAFLMHGFQSEQVSNWAKRGAHAATANCFGVAPILQGGASGYDVKYAAGFGDGELYTSTDGQGVWTLRVTFAAGAPVNAICYSLDLNLWVAVGGVSLASGIIYTSPDGVTWTHRATGDAAQAYNDVVWSHEAGVFAAVGDAGQVYTSPDGVTWTARVSGIIKDLVRVASLPTFGAGGGFVAFGSASTSNHYWTSPSGAAWTQQNAPGAANIDVSGNDGQGNGAATIMIVEHDGSVWTTGDGLMWNNPGAIAGAPSFFGKQTLATNTRSWVLVCGSQAGTPNQVFATFDGGATWLRKATPLAVSPNPLLSVGGDYKTGVYLLGSAAGDFWTSLYGLAP